MNHWEDNLKDHKRLIYCVFILLIILTVVYIYPKKFNKEYSGVIYRLGESAYSEKIKISFEGYLSKRLLKGDKFQGTINIGDKKLTMIKMEFGNIVLFIPVGIYLPLLKNDKRVLINLFFIFIVSLFIEIIQGLLGIGAPDIDDIILNCIGGWIGILVYKSLLFILRDEKKVRTAITILSAIIGLPVILYLLFMVRLRF
jgi:hypothetical protein